MSTLVEKEDWEALIEVLNEASKQLVIKRVEPVKQNILEFVNTAAMLELKDLADIGESFNEFLLETVAPQWNEEAVATLSFAIGALAEKMQLNEYGPRFSSELSEIYLYLTFYENEEQEPLTSPEAVSIGKLTEAEPMDIPLPAPADDLTGEVESGAQALKLPEPEGKAESKAMDVGLPEPGAEFETEASSAFVPEDTDEIGYVIDSIDWYRELLKSDPASKAFCLLAEEFCFRNQWEEAIDTCRGGLRFHPRNLRGRVLLGWALWEKGEAEEAQRVLEGARRDLERNAVLYRVLAQAAERRGDSLEAQNLMDIYQKLEAEREYQTFEPSEIYESPPPEEVAISVSAETEPAVRPKEATTGQPEPEPVSQEPALVTLLSALLLKFDRQPEEILQEQSIFSDEDRKSLKEILRAGVH